MHVYLLFLCRICTNLVQKIWTLKFINYCIRPGKWMRMYLARDLRKNTGIFFLFFFWQLFKRLTSLPLVTLKSSGVRKVWFCHFYVEVIHLLLKFTACIGLSRSVGATWDTTGYLKLNSSCSFPQHCSTVRAVIHNMHLCSCWVGTS